MFIKKGNQVKIISGKDKGKTGEILDLAASIGLVEKSGAWYSYNGDRIGQGRENAKNFLKDNPEIALKIEQEIRSHGKENKANEENEKVDVVEEEIAVD